MRNFACDLGAKMVQHMPAKWRHHCHCHPLRLVSLPPSLLPFFVAHVPLRYALEFHAFIRKDYEMRRVPAMFCMHFLWADAMAFLFLPSISNCFHCHPAVYRCFFVQFVYPSVFSSACWPPLFPLKIYMQKSVANSLGKHTHFDSRACSVVTSKIF